MLNYVPDDLYIESAYVKPSPGLHGEFRFTFRPSIPAEVAKVSSQSQELSDESGIANAAKFMASKIKTWSLTDPNGAAVPISDAITMRLRPELFHRVRRIVMGYDAADVDPKTTDEPVAAAEKLVADQKN